MDYAAVAEGHRIVATWIAGTPESKELVLSANEEGAMLSANVCHGEEGEEHPWYLTFYDEEVGPGFDERGYLQLKDAVAAAEEYFDLAGFDVDGQSIVPATYELGYLLGKQEGALKALGEGYAIGKSTVCNLLLQMLDAGCDYAEIGELAENPSKCLSLLAEYGIDPEQGCC